MATICHQAVSKIPYKRWRFLYKNHFHLGMMASRDFHAEYVLLFSIRFAKIRPPPAQGDITSKYDLLFRSRSHRCARLLSGLQTRERGKTEEQVKSLATRKSTIQIIHWHAQSKQPATSASTCASMFFSMSELPTLNCDIEKGKPKTKTANHA